MKDETLKMIEEMGNVNNKFGLFEPHIWKDKIGDSLWHCKIVSCDAVLVYETGDTLDKVVKKSYGKIPNINQ